MRKSTKNWILSSDYDIETSYHLLKTKRYVYVVFMCHLATEKLLKAIISETQETEPPRSHNLLFLARLGKIEIPTEHQTIIKYLNTLSVPTRYPSDISKLAKEFNQQLANKYFKLTKDFLKWLKTHPKLQK